VFVGDVGGTGFGTVTADLGRAMLKLGEDVRFLSTNSPGASVEEDLATRIVDAATLVPKFTPTGEFLGGEQQGIVRGLVTGTTDAKMVTGQPWGDWTPEAAILLGDFRAVEIMFQREPDAFDGVPWFHYAPIEGVDLPPSWGALWSYGTPVAMSNFGADEIAKVTGSRPPVVYHGVDTETFHPATPKTPVVLRTADDRPDIDLTSKVQCKQMWAAWFGLQVGKKWLLRCDRHMPRKRYNQMIRALLPVLGRQPDVTLICHTHAFDQGGDLVATLSKFPTRLIRQPSVEQPTIAYALGNRAHAQIIVTDASLPRQALVSLYNAADLYVSTSAEGFGLTIAEALACGVPAVGLDYSAVPEVIGPAGVTVPRAYLVENEYDHFWAAIDDDEFAKRVEFLITHQTRREDLGRKGPAHITSSFRWDAAAQEFQTLLHDPVVTRQAA
jgi:glycosyltransferase involved in cell wall biosynthesis